MTTAIESGRMLIDGELVESSTGQRLISIDPATEQPLGEVPDAGREDVDRAVVGALRAQPMWAAISVAERAKFLRKVAHAMRSRSEEILHTEVVDTGNTIRKMAADTEQAAAAIEYFAGLGTELKGESVPASPENIHFTVREPYGVVGRIIPFNHPIKFAAHALAAPLMAGNAVVIKPPHQSPLSAVILAQICCEVLPAGVVNILTGRGSAGEAIVRHPAIKRIAFTGSVPTGVAIARAAAETGVKHLSFELGGKNPLIAFPDVEPVTIADAAVRGMNFSWQGQSCGSTSRLLVHESIYDAVLDHVCEAVARIKVGMPLDVDTDMGPINSEKQYDHVTRMVAAGRSDGARLVIGGDRPTGSEFRRGYWLEPTVFADVDPAMTIAQEEIFGPVLSVLKWNDERQAIEIANGTAYGLTASIWTSDIKTAFRVARAVKAGYVWINGVAAHFYGTPFGGQKSSGLGREEGLDELMSYTECKSIHVIIE